jgi:hypothetical protein
MLATPSASRRESHAGEQLAQGAGHAAPAVLGAGARLRVLGPEAGVLEREQRAARRGRLERLRHDGVDAAAAPRHA